MALPLDLLKTLVVFSDSPTVLDAARRLGLSQPAVSVQLRRLEESLPQPVFAQEGKRKVLTHYGRALADDLRKRFADVDRAVEGVNRLYASPELMTLRVGVRPELFYRASELVRFPGTVHFLGMSNEESIAGLLSHQIDIAFAHKKPDVATVYAQKIFSEGAKLCVHRRWLAGKPLDLDLARSGAFLTETPFLSYKDEPLFAPEWFAHAGVDLERLRVHRICEDWRAIMRFVEMEIGFSILPSGIVTGSREVESVELPPSVIPVMTFYALYHEELRKLPAVMRYLKF